MTDKELIATLAQLVHVQFHLSPDVPTFRECTKRICTLAQEAVGFQ